MKAGVILTARSSSARRPSVRAKTAFNSVFSACGLKLILSPDFHGFEARRCAAQEALGDAREPLRRVRHVEVIQIIAQTARARTLFEQLSRVRHERTAAQVLFL